MGASQLIPTALLWMFVSTALPTAQEVPSNTVAGLTMDVWKLDGALPQWPQLIAGQSPNLSRVVGDISHIRGPLHCAEGEISNHFIGELRGWLKVDHAGRYLLRLVGDDGAQIILDGNRLMDSESRPGFVAEGGADLEVGMHALRIPFYQDEGKFALSLQWAPPGEVGYHAIPADMLRTDAGQTFVTSPGIKRHDALGSLRLPGDGRPLTAVHPAYRLDDFRPRGFEPQVGALCPMNDGRLAVATWDARGAIWILDPAATTGPAHPPQLFAQGLSEPLGLLEADDGFIVAQKGEITHVRDRDGDGCADSFDALAFGWPHSANYHEFLFNLVQRNNRYWFATSVPLRGGLTDYLPSTLGDFPVSDGPGSLWSCDLAGGTLSREARGLRTPNGMDQTVDGELFGCDNQGSWLPSSRMNHLHCGGFYGHQERRAGSEIAEPPVVWFPHGEIGNSPSQPVLVVDGPHRGQMYVGDVTYGGIQRVAVSRIGEIYQGTLFMHSQGLEAGVNRLAWGRAADRSLYVGGVGANGNWNHKGKTFGLQRLTPNWRTDESPDVARSAAFEVVRVDAQPHGILVTLSSPVDRALLDDSAHYEVTAWRYEAREAYGGPKVDPHKVRVTHIESSPDGRQVRLDLDPWRTGEVVSLRLVELSDRAGRAPWSTESWSTINAIPSQNLPFSNFVGSPPRPASAITLFDEMSDKSLSPWKRERGELITPTVAAIGEGDLITQQSFTDVFLHFEWLSPPGGSVAEGQRNGNGGVKLAQRYEVQIMNTPVAPYPPKINEAGSIYRQHAATTNASTGAGTWQSYDIWFTAPRWDGLTKISNARMTLVWNGVLVHDDVEVAKQTGMSAAEEPGAHPILFQAHPTDAQGPVRLRNIWCADLNALPRAKTLDQ